MDKWSKLSVEEMQALWDSLWAIYQQQSIKKATDDTLINKLRIELAKEIYKRNNKESLNQALSQHTLTAPLFFEEK
jgi:hypothetical protein